MLMDMKSLLEKYNIKPKEILHIGAHLGEEAGQYYASKIPKVTWVEANPDVLSKLQYNIYRYNNQSLIWALVTDVDDDLINFNVTNYDGMSSSVFQFGEHVKYSPDTIFTHTLPMRTTTLDTLCRRFELKPDFLCMDIQGAELLALKGAKTMLGSVNWIYLEVSTHETYLGGATMLELDKFLGPTFARKETCLHMHAGTHGDAFYVRVNNEV